MKIRSRPPIVLLGMSLVTGALASACCLFPVLLGFLGITGIALELDFFERYRGYLIGFAVLLFGLSALLAFRRRGDSVCEMGPDGENCGPRNRRSLILWGAAIIILILLVKFPDYF